eukprot:2931198-Alexandrium_andersonii.AAC.1
MWKCVQKGFGSTDCVHSGVASSMFVGIEWNRVDWCGSLLLEMRMLDNPVIAISCLGLAAARLSS